MPDFNFNLHAKQKEIFIDPARFKVVAAGRRGGKTHLACVTAGTEVLKEENERGYKLTYENEVWYICPVFEQGKKQMWGKIKEIWGDVITKTYENTCEATFVNGRIFRIIGADRPNNLRGSGLSYVILDEYAFMKSEVWDIIIRPMLMEVLGGALFIGTPEGKNHFYDLWMLADREDKKNWAAFHFSSKDNPLLPREEFVELTDGMSNQAIRQEIEASFEAAGGGKFTERMIQYAQRPTEPGTIYMAVDPAGFGKGDGLVKSELKRLDETAIAVVEVSPKGWFVHDILSGRWNVRETALRIIKTAKDYQPAALGIEKGSLFNAIHPYLEDEMRRLGVFPHVVPCTHGGQKKVERITWALQGRFEKGRIVLKEDHWNRKFTDQLLDFPNPMAHDDLLDALAYIDQVATTNYLPINDVTTDFEPLDEYIGI